MAITAGVLRHVGTAALAGTTAAVTVGWTMIPPTAGMEANHVYASSSTQPPFADYAFTIMFYGTLLTSFAGTVLLTAAAAKGLTLKVAATDSPRDELSLLAVLKSPRATWLLVIVETIVGVALWAGSHIMVGVASLLFMAFAFVNVAQWRTDPVKACGCLGDALPIAPSLVSPWLNAGVGVALTTHYFWGDSRGGQLIGDGMWFIAGLGIELAMLYWILIYGTGVLIRMKVRSLPS